MAVMLRCSSCFFTPPNSIARSPPSDPLHRKSHAPELRVFENIASCDARRERRWGILELVVLHDFHDDGPMSYGSIATSSSHNNGMEGKIATLSYKVERLVSSLRSTFNGSSEMCQMLPSLHCQENKWVGIPTMAFLVSNALMLSTPLKALAETCEADNSVFNMNMPLLLAVALIGATVGGLLARQRRGELERMNEQLRQINTALRRQAKIESYAPTLSYAPVGGRIPETEVIVDPKKQELISRLKSGKNFLRNQELEKAFLEFKTALELAQNLKDPIEEKKAARGLGASLQRQGKYREAIKYHSMVLAISEREGEDSGNTEAYGAIADCYTELGDLERAGKFYDKYISGLETD